MSKATGLPDRVCGSWQLVVVWQKRHALEFGCDQDRESCELGYYATGLHYDWSLGKGLSEAIGRTVERNTGEAGPLRNRRPSAADMMPGTLFVHENKAAASCRTPNASRLSTPTASAAVRVPPLGGLETSIHRAVSPLNVVR